MNRKSTYWPICGCGAPNGWRYYLADGRSGWRCDCGRHEPDQIETEKTVELPEKEGATVSYARLCQICDGEARWYLLRRGDAQVSWGCNEHLAQVCESMQRERERTEVIVWKAVVLSEVLAA